MVTADRAPFYKYGPAQGFGPDFQLSSGERVTLLTRDLGFSQIRTARAQVGYVANEDIAPAPPVPATPPPPKIRIHSNQPEPDYPLPPELEPPLPDLPVPKFRY